MLLRMRGAHEFGHARVNERIQYSEYDFGTLTPTSFEHPITRNQAPDTDLGIQSVPGHLRYGGAVIQENTTI